MVRFLVGEGAMMRHKVQCPGMLWNGIILLHDNIRLHSANLVKDKLQRFGWETLKHPPYSPDLSSCDFHIYCDLKKDIRGRQFHSDDEMQEWVEVVDPSATYLILKDWN